MRWLAALALVIALGGSDAALARRTVAEPRFPASVSEQLMRDLLAAGRVEPARGTTRGAELRWGAAPVDEQDSSMRAVVQALLGNRPPLGVSAAILAIARVESGWNAESRNPASSACGIFQFVRRTWESYGGTHDTCDVPALNAALGVEHLTSIYRAWVRPQMAPLTLLGSEAERVEWTYRLLYAYHYHGEGSPLAPEGGALVAQSAADAGLPQLKTFFSILKRATAPPRRPRVRATRPTRAIRAPARRAKRARA